MSTENKKIMPFDDLKKSDNALYEKAVKFVEDNDSFTPSSMDVKEIIMQSVKIIECVNSLKHALENDEDFNMRSFELGLYAGGLASASYTALCTLKFVSGPLLSEAIKFGKEQKENGGDENYLPSAETTFLMSEVIATISAMNRMSEVLLEAFGNKEEALGAFKNIVKQITGKDSDYPVQNSLKDKIEANDSTTMSSFSIKVALKRAQLEESDENKNKGKDE